MELDKKLDFISKLRLKQMSLSNEEIAIFNEIVEDLKVLDDIKCNSTMPNIYSDSNIMTLKLEVEVSNIFNPEIKDDETGEIVGYYAVANAMKNPFERLLEYFTKYYKERLQCQK